MGISVITAEMWEKAISNLHNTQYRQETKVRNMTVTPAWRNNATSLALIFELQDRYDDGERSIELYNAIMEVK